MADPRSIVWIDKFGVALAVYDSVVIPAGVPGSLLMGVDGGTARRIVVDAVGRVVSVGIGVAGVPAGGVMSVQGVAGGLPMPISGTVTLGASTVLADQGAPALTALAWPIKVTDGVDTVGISTVGLQKALKVDVIQSVGGSGGTSSLFGVAFPLSGTAGGFFDGVNMQGARVYDTDTGVGNQYTLGVNLRLAAGGGSVEAGTAAQPLRIDPTGTTTQPISAAALPLPAGAATEATLATRATEATLATRASEATLATRASEATLATLLLDATFTGRINTQGQKLMAGSTPVVVASDQSAIPISAAALPLPAGAATEATLATRASEATLATRASEATLATRASEATLATRLADATFTGRINTLGQKTMANSTPVVIASDQSAIPVTNTPVQPANSAVTSVASSAASVTILAANANRKGAMITNDSTANLYLKLGAVASTTSYTTKLIPGAYYEVPPPVYTGVIDGIWDAVNGNARVTETTP